MPTAAPGEAYWPRLIALVDMDCFFAQIEQRDNPELRGRPVAVTNGLTGSCIITCSYEARRFGIKTGMRLKEGLSRCPHLIRCPTRPVQYTGISTNIMQALADLTPVIEVYSVDEAFLDLTACQSLWGAPASIGRLIKRRVFAVSGLTCSVGLSGDKGTAKFAAKLNKPDGLTLIPPWQARGRLSTVPVTDLSGVKDGIGGFLKARGAYTCGDVANLPVSVLGRRFGHPGRRLWCSCQGADPEPVSGKVPAPQSMGHGKVLPPNTRDLNTVRTYLLHMCEKLSARLRQHELAAQSYSLGLLTHSGWIGMKFRAPAAIDDSHPLIDAAHRLLSCWRGQGVYQVQVTAHDPSPAGLQPDLFAGEHLKRRRLNQVMDAINRRFGEFTLAPAALLSRSDMPNVIAPAWRPDGHRQTINGMSASRVTARISSGVLEI